MITAAQHYSTRALQMLDRTFGQKSSHGMHFNAIQKSSLFAQHFFPEQKEYFQTPLAWSSICKTLLAPGIAARHVYYRGVETKNLGKSFKGYRVGEKSLAQLVFGKSKSDLTKGGYGLGETEVKDVAHGSPSITGWAVGLSKLAQKICDSAGNLLYFTMPPSLTFSRDSLKVVKEWKSTFQVVEYTPALCWDATELVKDLWNGSLPGYSNAFSTATNFFALSAATASTYRFHFMDKKSSAAHQVQGFVLTCAVAAAVLPYIKELFNVSPPKLTPVGIESAE